MGTCVHVRAQPLRPFLSLARDTAGVDPALGRRRWALGGDEHARKEAAVTGRWYRGRVEQAATDEARIRIVTDIVAGLTEAAALALFRRMSGIDPGTLLDAAARIP
jgi:hypothetical protein